MAKMPMRGSTPATASPGARATRAECARCSAALGLPTLDGLGADGDAAHAVDERVELASLPQRAALVAGLLARIAA